MVKYTEVVRIHTVWRTMQYRCLNPKSKDYPNYGGRGITISSEWLDFEVFCQWMLDNGAKQGIQIDRVDNDKGYSPENCRLVTPTENNRNRRSNRFLTVWGETKCVSQWEDDPRCVVSKYVIENRINSLGWEDLEKVLTTPKDIVRKSNNPTHCKKGGHEYTYENTYYSKSAPHLKKCRKCHANRQLSRYHTDKKLGLYE
jgi:hypothetical protein